MGLKERLEAATSQKEVDTLLKEGKGYKDASEGIKRRWSRIAKETLKQFSKDKNAKKKEKK